MKKKIHLPYVYLWLLPVVSVPVLYTIRNNTNVIFFVSCVIIHLGLFAFSLVLLGPNRSKHNGSTASTAVLLLLGAALTFISATTFPTTSLTAISADKFGHYWTSIGFFVSELIFLSGMMYLSKELEKNAFGPHKVGFLLMLTGGVLWLFHLSFRVTVMVWAADLRSESGVIPDSFEMMLQLSGSLYVAYMALTYLGFIGYGLSLLRTELLPRWLAHTTLLFGISTPLLFAFGLGPFRMPIAIQVIPWLIGIYLIRAVRSRVG